jgi:broad specificity phosphatase PhoE
MLCSFITHPEVIIDPAVRIEDWALSSAGRARAARLAHVVPRCARVVSSSELKARETAGILAEEWGVDASVDRELGEMDRSATGYLPPHEFEPTVDAFFARPHESVRGWERAIDAQRRIERAVRRQADLTPGDTIAFVAHGGVGGLLLAGLDRAPISRDYDQPGMGSYFLFDAHAQRALSSWRRIV